MKSTDIPLWRPSTHAPAPSRLAVLKCEDMARREQTRRTNFTGCLTWKDRSSQDDFPPSVLSRLYYSTDGDLRAPPAPRCTPQPTATCCEIYHAVEEANDRGGLDMSDICQRCTDTEKGRANDIGRPLWIRCECKDKCAWTTMTEEARKDIIRRERHSKMEAKARALEERKRAKLQRKQDKLAARAARNRLMARHTPFRSRCNVPQHESKTSSSFRIFKSTVAVILDRIKCKQHPIQTEARVLHMEGFVEGDSFDVEHQDSGSVIMSMRDRGHRISGGVAGDFP